MNQPISKTVWSEIDRWLGSLPTLLPLIPCTDTVDQAKVMSLLSQCQNELSEMQIAGLWLRIGEIDRSHTIVQADSSSVASYMHGMVHRIEGDYWNANYWFNRARDNQLLAFIQESVGLQLSSGTQPIAPTFSATTFTNQCEQVVRNKNSQEHKRLESIAFAEWQGVWFYLTSA